MPRKKHKLTDDQVDRLLFECHCHCCLDALGAPQHKYVGRRLTLLCEKQGVDPYHKKPKGVPNGGIVREALKDV